MQAISETVNGGLRELRGGLRSLAMLRDVFVVLGATASALWAAHMIAHAVVASAAAGGVV